MPSKILFKTFSKEIYDIEAHNLDLIESFGLWYFFV